MNSNHSYKVQASFNEHNKARIESILTSDNDLERLKNISPSSIVIDLTWRCNYECMNCIDNRVVKHDSKLTGAIDQNVDMSLEMINDIFEYAHANRVRGISTMGGEVFSYIPGITLAMTKSIDYKIPLKTVSNGSKLGNFIDLIVEAYSLPGANLRVSINADHNNYHTQTGQVGVVLTDVLESLSRITDKGGNVMVSTIVFPEASHAMNHDSNINQLENIAHAVQDAGVKTWVLLPGRDPYFMKRVGITESEKDLVKKIKDEKNDMTIIIDDVINGSDNFSQDLSFHPCYAALLYTLIGSDGSMYMCSDHRGNDAGRLTTLKKPGDFASYWHSEERVKKVLDFVAQKECCTMTCLRYDINKRFQVFQQEFNVTKTIPTDLIISDDTRKIFI